jgi:excisionase family DNA binding protein
MGAPTSLLIDQAAQRLGVSRRTIYYRIREGRLQTIRTRCGSQRVLVATVEALLREGDARKAALPPDDGVASRSEATAFETGIYGRRQDVSVCEQITINAETAEPAEKRS